MGVHGLCSWEDVCIHVYVEAQDNLGVISQEMPSMFFQIRSLIGLECLRRLVSPRTHLSPPYQQCYKYKYACYKYKHGLLFTWVSDSGP